MIEVYEECVRLLQAGKDAVLATVFEAKGSAPRTAGAKMVVRPDGSILGTIGGGRLEHDAVVMALRLFDTRQSAIHAFELTGNDVAGMDMICGGRGEVWLHFMADGDKNNVAVCQATAEVLRRREQAWLVTAIGSEQNEPERQYGLIAADQSATGIIHVDQEWINQWSKGPADLSVYTEMVGTQRFLIESIRPGRTVFVFGAGHVSQQVVPLCEKVGFRTVVLDDRAEYACRERFSNASDIVVLESFEHWAGMIIDELSFIVILTRGHIHDKAVLAKALRTPAGYVGMIGSRRKRDKIYQALREEGFTQQDIDRVHSPIGMDIGAETPEELAVSIVGELIKVRADQNKCR
ncbi:MAG: XdhC family aldehyde oxidoreductase maturation factor [Negativicutes bacterium]